MEKRETGIEKRKTGIGNREREEKESYTLLKDMDSFPGRVTKEGIPSSRIPIPDSPLFGRRDTHDSQIGQLFNSGSLESFCALCVPLRFDFLPFRS